MVTAFARDFSHPERLRAAWAARDMLKRIRDAVAMAEFIEFDSLAESFRKDEARLIEHARRKGWDLKGMAAQTAEVAPRERQRGWEP